jgi:transcription initiation factor IIE alpha subunit
MNHSEERRYSGFYKCPACGTVVTLEDVSAEKLYCEQCHMQLEEADPEEEIFEDG